MLMRAVVIVALALTVAGCKTTSTIDISNPPAEWRAKAQPLPDIPKCGHLKSEKARIVCREAYDKKVRLMYIELAEKHESLAGFIERLGLKDGSWDTQIID
jgi:hypothetical protein